MADRHSETTANRNRVKLVLIPVLAFVLLAVLYGQSLSGSPPSEQVPETMLAPMTSQVDDPGGTENADVTQKHNFHQHPPTRIPLESLLSHNPFAFPAALAPAETIDEPVAVLPSVSELDTEMEYRQQLLEQWRLAEITAYYQSGDEAVAMVGERVLREGDIVDGKIRVVEIQSGKVTYEICYP